MFHVTRTQRIYHGALSPAKTGLHSFPQSFRSNFPAGQRKGAAMKSVKQLLQVKGSAVHAIAANASVLDAIKLMAEKGIGALVVLDEGRLAGVLSERDYARKVILHGRSSQDTAVREIMTEKVVTVRSEQTVEDCMALMTEQRIRHLPVVDAGKLAGVVSIGDLVKEVIADREETIKQLESYIHH
jgi:CBS domain-containing protein